MKSEALPPRKPLSASQYILLTSAACFAESTLLQFRQRPVVKAWDRASLKSRDPWRMLATVEEAQVCSTVLVIGVQAPLGEFQPEGPAG